VTFDLEVSFDCQASLDLQVSFDFPELWFMTNLPKVISISELSKTPK
jgi:hypothetical protein